MASKTNAEEDLPPKPSDLDSFLDHFLSNHRDDNFISVKHGNYFVSKNEIVGEVVDWTMQYLQYMSCPPYLEASLTRAVLDEAKAHYLAEKGQDQVDATGLPQNAKGLRTLNLLQNVTASVNEVCQRLKNQGKSEVLPSRIVPCSVGAVKNGRRKMEDRHVVFHDINAIYAGHANQSVDDDEVSFYGVYDGHAGKDAAAFAASHLHGKIFESPFYPADPVSAIRDAFHKTDATFLEKSKTEDLRSGTTAIVALIRGSTIYTSWLGDSQAVLVRDGVPIKIVEPHKPNRPDENSRIESLGGSVIFWGTWRVNGQLAVSRAIGDGDYKPYVCSDPDVTTIQKNGSEDFLIIACDGLWDTVTPEDATNCVMNCLKETEGNVEKVSKELITLAKDNGSSDNITILVVFLRPIDQLISENERGGQSTSLETLHEGITSTCSYINKDRLESLNTSLKSTSPMELPKNEGVDAFSTLDSIGFANENPFGDLSTKVDGKETDDVDSSLHAVLNGLKSENFKTASPSMFESSSDFERNAERSSSDFMANQDSAWISSGTPPVFSQQQKLNPFAAKGDSGFISPVCAPKDLNAPSKELTENLNSVTDNPNHSDEEVEVAKLLMGGIESHFGELILSSRNETPTPPIEDTGDTLEDILAACRDKPDETEEDYQDSDSSEEEEVMEFDCELVLKNQGSSEPEPVEIGSSDSGEDEGFTFIKQDEFEMPNVILKSALVTETELSELQSETIIDNTELMDHKFEENEPIVSQFVDQKFIDEAMKTSNIIDVIQNGDEHCLLNSNNLTSKGENQDNNFEKEAPVLIKLQDDMDEVQLNLKNDEPEKQGFDSSKLTETGEAVTPATQTLENQPGPSSVIIESQEVPNPDQASFFIKPLEPTTVDLPTLQEAVLEVIPDTVFQSPIFEESEEAVSDNEENACVKLENEVVILSSEIKEAVESETLEVESLTFEQVLPIKEIPGEVELILKNELINSECEASSEVSTAIISEDDMLNAIQTVQPEENELTLGAPVKLTKGPARESTKKSDNQKLISSTKRPMGSKPPPIVKNTTRTAVAPTKPSTVTSSPQKLGPPKSSNVKVTQDPIKKVATARPTSAVSRAPPSTTSNRPVTEKKEVERKPLSARPTSAPAAKPVALKTTAISSKPPAEKEKSEDKKPPASTVTTRVTSATNASRNPRVPSARPGLTSTSRPTSATTSSKVSGPKTLSSQPSKPVPPKNVSKPTSPVSPAKSLNLQAKKTSVSTTSSVRGPASRSEPSVKPPPTRALLVSKKPSGSLAPKPTDLAKRKLVKKAENVQVEINGGPKTNGDLIPESNSVNRHEEAVISEILPADA